MGETWDCAVVGGGGAGLSAALVLGRARRRVLLVDAGVQSNLSAAGIGGLLGNEIGRSLDRADRAYMYRATERAAAAPVGETITWRNPDSGNYGAVTPTREGVNNRTGAYCREYQTEVIVGGRRQHGYGQACRQPDGSWKII